MKQKKTNKSKTKYMRGPHIISQKKIDEEAGRKQKTLLWARRKKTAVFLQAEAT